MLSPKNVESLFKDRVGSKTLYDVARTRWIQRIVGMENFHDLFEAILCTFEEMVLNETSAFNRDTVSKALSFRNSIERFEFIISMVITRQVFDMTMDVTKLLQARDNDSMKTITLIESLKDQFSNIRSNVDEYHKKWFKIAKDLAESLNLTVKAPRITKRQVHRQNTPSSSVEEHFKLVITIPLVDHVISELEKRFDHSLTVYHGLVLIPSRLFFLISKEKNGNEIVLSWRKQLDTFVNFYYSDFPNPLAMDGEVEIWIRFWEKYQLQGNSLPDSVEATLREMPHDSDSVFVNIEVALKLLATIPVTSCECERSFSAMKRLKTYTRSQMSAERLDGLALMHVHLDHTIDKERVVTSFNSRKQRRLDFGGKIFLVCSFK